MSNPLVIVAQIEAKADQIEFVKSELSKLIAISRNEKGCIQYDLHQDNNSPELFLFFEKWESHKHLEKHIDSAHIRDYMKATANAVEIFTMNELSKVS